MQAIKSSSVLSAENVSGIEDLILEKVNSNNNANSEKRTVLKDPSYRKYLTSNLQMLASLWIDEESQHILLEDTKIKEISETDEFIKLVSVIKIKKTIPACDLLVHAIINKSIIDIIDLDQDLVTAILKDVSMRCLLSIDSDANDFVKESIWNVVKLLKNDDVIDRLKAMPETICRLERITQGSNAPPMDLPTINYGKEETRILEIDMKRILFTLDESLKAANNIFGKDEKYINEFQNESNNNTESVKQSMKCETQIVSQGSENVVSVQENSKTFEGLEEKIDKLTTKLRLMSSNYECEKEKVLKLDAILLEKNEELKQGVLKLVEKGEFNKMHSLVVAETQLKQMEIDNMKLRHDFECNKDLLDNVVKENTELMRKLKEFTTKLVLEKNNSANILKLKAGLEEIVTQITNERDKYKRELKTIEKEISQTKISCDKRISEMQNENNKLLKEYNEATEILKEDNHALMNEIASIKSFADNQKSELFQNKSSLESAKLNVEDLTRKLQIVTEENSSSRSDLTSLLNEYQAKVDEICKFKELLEEMKEEQDVLKSDKFALERDVERLSEQLQHMENDSIESGRRLGDVRNLCLDTERLYQNAQTTIVSLQADVRHITLQLQASEEEKKALLANINKHIENKSICENELSACKSKLQEQTKVANEEKKHYSDAKNEIKFLSETLERSNSQLDMIKSSLEKEKTLHMALREQYMLEEKQKSVLEYRLSDCESEIITLQQSLMNERSCKDKQVDDQELLLDELKMLRLKVEKNDDLLLSEEEKFKTTLEHMRNDFLNDIDFIRNEKETMLNTTNKLREELNDLRNQLSNKDLQLRSCYQSIGQLDSEAKGRKELECQLMLAERELNNINSKMQLTLEDLESERTKQHQLNEQNDKLRLTIQQLKEGIKVVKEEFTKEVFLLKSQLQNVTLNSEQELSCLKDELNKKRVELKTFEASLITSQQSKEALQASHKNFEHTIDALKRRLHQEITTRKVCEQRLETLRHCNNSDSLFKNNYKSNTDNDNNNAASIQQSKDNEILLLQKQISQLNSNCRSQEAHIQTLEIQLADLENERNSLIKCNIQKQNNTNDDRIMNTLYNQVEMYNNERHVLFQSSQKLSVDLQHARKALAEKTKENSQLFKEINEYRERTTRNLTKN